MLPLTALLLRARTVHRPGAFVVRELTGRERVCLYRLRESGLKVAIRHGSGDVVTLGEVFHEHHYVPPGEVERALMRIARVVDLGANVGLFGLFAAARWPEAEILAFEPDPANIAVHEHVIDVNGLGERWRLVPAAAGAHGGRARFIPGGVALSHLAAAGERAPAVEVSVEDVLPRLAHSDLLKMDIEGGEWAILDDPRFRESPPRALVLEYHAHLCPGPDPRAAAESALAAAGLRMSSIWHRADGHGMLWAWQS
jgi:FkbM family methyltransferase